MSAQLDITAGSCKPEAGRGWLWQYRIDGKAMKARGATKREAAAARDAQIAAAKAGAAADRTTMLSGLVDAFVSRRGVRAEATVVRYHRAAQRLIDTVGDKPVADVSRDDIELVMSRMAASGIKASTIGAWRKALNPVMAWALDHGKATTNPLAGVKVATFNAADSEAPRFLDLTDTVLLTKYLRADLTDPHVACLLMLHAGLRIGEALGLAWSDVDIEARTITVRQQATEHATLTATLKTRSSRRVLRNLPTMLTNALAEHRAAHPEAVLVCSTKATKRRDLGTPLARRGVQQSLRMACERSGVAYVNPHGLRHTAGSLLYEATGSLPKVAAFLGHVDLVLVTRLYVHDTTSIDSGALVDQLMGGLS
jgi:integrase